MNGSCWNSTYIQRRDGSMYAIRITEQVTRKKKAGTGFLKVLMIAFGVFFVLLGIVFSRGFMLSGFLLICLYLAYDF